MTVFVETDFPLALSKDDDWLREHAENTLGGGEVVTSPFAYLETLILLEQYQFGYARFFANMFDVIGRVRTSSRSC